MKKKLLFIVSYLCAMGTFAQTNCYNPFQYGADSEMITKVEFNTISNTSPFTSGTTPSYENFKNITTQVDKNSSYTLAVKGPSGYFGSNVVALIDWNGDGNFTSDEFHNVGILPDANPFYAHTIQTQIQVPNGAITGQVIMRIVKASNIALVNNPLDNIISLLCTDQYRAGQIEEYTLDIQGAITPPLPTIDSMTVSTVNNLPALIPTLGATLALQSAIYPANVNQAVTWQIQPITGQANISQAGVVTGTVAGTVRAIATSVYDVNHTASIVVQINQIILPESVQISVLNNGAPTINQENGSLILQATVYPPTAAQGVSWTLVPGSGQATISSAGTVTAVQNGVVYAVASSTVAPNVRDTLQITISYSGLSVENIKSLVRVYPNPSTDFINIEAQGISNVQVFDLLGKELSVEVFGENQVSVSSLPHGIYQLRLEINGVSHNVNIVKE